MLFRSHHHHQHLPHDDDDIDDFPVETGYSVVCHDDSSNQPSPRRKLKHAFSSSYLFKSRNRSSRYNLKKNKKKKSTHENMMQEVRGLRLLTSTITGRKESVSTCRIIQGDVLNDEHGSIGILHAKVTSMSYIYEIHHLKDLLFPPPYFQFTLMTSSPVRDNAIIDDSISNNKNCGQNLSPTHQLDTGR